MATGDRQPATTGPGATRPVAVDTQAAGPAAAEAAITETGIAEPRLAGALRQGSTCALLVWSIALLFSTATAEILLGLAVALRVASWAVAAGARGRGVRRGTGPEAVVRGAGSAPGFDQRGRGAASFDQRAGGAAGFDLRGGPTTRLLPWLLLAFVGLYLLSVLTAVDPHTSARKLPTLFRYAVFVTILAAPLRGRAWSWFYTLQAAVVVVLAIQAGHHLAIGWDRAATPNLHYNTLAQVAGTISLLLFAAAGFGPADHARERRWLAAGALLSAILLLLTLSRAAWMGWLSAAAVLVLLLRAHWRWLIPAVVALVAIGVFGLPAARHRAEAMTSVAEDPEFTRRYDLWAMAGAIIRDRPLTGIGPGGIGVIYDHYKTGVLVDDPNRWPHVHNDLLEIALSHGLAAAAVWAAIVVAVYWALLRRLRAWSRLPGSWAKAAFIGAVLSFHLFTVCGLLHDNYVIYIKINMLLLLLGLIVVADRELGSATPSRQAGSHT